MRTRLPFFGVIRVSGEERHTFLHNQLSNDILHLPAQHSCYATYNTAKGRVIANLIVHHHGDDLLLVLAKDLVETVCKRLKMFVLRAKVHLEILNDWGISGSLPENANVLVTTEPQFSFANNVHGEIVLPHLGCLKILPECELPPHSIVLENAWNRHEILSGYPWISAATSEMCVAQMLNQHIIGGVHFRKGCYPGQEIIARAQYRGQVKRGLVIIRGDSPVPSGSIIQDSQGNEAGVIINHSGDLNLAILKFSSINNGLQNDSGQAYIIERLFFEMPEKT